MLRGALGRDIFTYSAAVSACEKSDPWLRAVELWTEMAQGNVECYAVTYSAAVSACGNGREWTLSLHLFSSMRRSKLHVDAVSLISVRVDIGVAVRVDVGAAARARVGAGSVERDTIMYSAVVSACEESSLGLRAVKLLTKMEQGNVECYAILYSPAVGACGNCRE